MDVAEPAAVKGQFRLAQNVEEAVLSQNRSFICLLDLPEDRERRILRVAEVVV